MQILDVVESVCEEQILYLTGASMTKKKKFCNIDTWVTTVFFYEHNRSAVEILIKVACFVVYYQKRVNLN